ncbi:unnamed protein product [Peniophora sp. CBMAI 1063]|nr:unnamed protein product [Peniophora sp. CBMAI 1063]
MYATVCTLRCSGRIRTVDRDQASEFRACNSLCYGNPPLVPSRLLATGDVPLPLREKGLLDGIRIHIR